MKKKGREMNITEKERINLGINRLACLESKHWKKTFCFKANGAYESRVYFLFIQKVSRK